MVSFEKIKVFLALILGLVVSSATAQTYTFTNASATGTNGPTQAQITAAYASTNLAGAVTSSNGIQLWTVPVGGNYRIEVYGASGYGPLAGKGAKMSGEFFLAGSTQLKILVGQMGGCCVGSGTNQYGGGGGSFVVTSTNTPLIVAGGGGGAIYNSTVLPSSHGTTAINGNPGTGTANGAGGINGGGGGEAGIAGGGGGFSGDGVGNPHGGKSFLNGGQGGTASSSGGWGGFGGGAGADSWNNGRGGGGGGYSGGGGAGSSTSAQQVGGGGGSYNTGLNQNNADGFNTGHGYVVITLLSPPVPNNMSASAFVNPGTGFCSGNQMVTVRVQNTGSNTVDSVMVGWSVNGVFQSNNWVTFTPPLGNVSSSNNTFDVDLGNYNFSPGTHTLKAWTKLPNNVVDTVVSNDTVTVTRTTQLSGTYTINSALPTGGTNFQTFTAFSDALDEFGVCGPVIANVNPSSGPYNEILKFNNIQGASAINTIRINGNGRTVQFNNTVNDRQLIQLLGTKYLTIDSLNFISQNATYGWAAVINGGAEYDSIMNCNFNLTATTSTSSANTTGFAFSGSLTSATTTGANVKNCYIGNNVINGPTGSGGYYYGLTLTSGCDSNVIENNTFNNFYFYGLYMNGARFTTLKGNEMARPTKTSVTTYYGIYTTGVIEGSKLIGNKIHTPGGTPTTSTNTAYGIYSLGDGTLTNPVLIANNIVYKMNTGGTSYGMYLSGTQNTTVAHNTIVYDQIQTGTSTQAGMWILGTNTNLDILNNNIVITGGNLGTKYGINYSTAASRTSINTAQRNNIFVNSSQSGAQWYAASPTATTFANMAAFQTAFPALENGSLSVDPGFVNASIGDLLPTNLILQSNGLNLGGLVPYDITEYLRGTLPTPGAYEIPSTPGPDAGIQALISPVDAFCANQQEVKIAIVNTGTVPLSNFQIQWSLNGIPQSPYTYVGTLPVFGLGQHQDTVIIGNVTIPSGLNTLKAWTTVAGDINNLNDTLLTTVAPSAFTTSATSDTICVGKNAMLNLTPNSGYTTGMIEWQISTNGTTFNAIPNSDQPSWTENNVTANRWFRAFINSGNGGCYSDTTSIVVIDPQITTATPGYSCGPGSVQLSATSSPGTIIEWFDVPTGGNALDTGSNFTTPVLTSTTTYYVSAKSGSGSGDIPDLIYYRFDVPGNSVANEASNPVGNNPAAVTGLTIGGVGQFGTGLQGTAGPTASNNVNPGWTGTHTGSWTISFWANMPTPPTTRYFFGNSSGNGTFRCFVGGAANGIRLTGGVPSITLDMPAWTAGTSVVTYVYDQSAGTVSGYINGVFQGSVTPGASYPLVGTNFVVGSQGTAMDGIMDEFRVYGRALTASEVAATYNSQLGGCEGLRQPIVATVHNIVQAEVTPAGPLGLCDGNTIQLTSVNTATDYVWLRNGTPIPNSNSATLSVTTAGQYRLVTIESSCSDTSDIVDITLSPTPTVSLGADFSICPENFATLVAQTDPGNTRLWDNNTTNTTRPISQAGTYFVTVTNSFNCTSSDTVVVSNYPSPMPDLGPDTLICVGEVGILNPGTFDSYLWNTGATSNSITVVDSGIYSVRVTNEFGCRATDSIRVSFVESASVEGFSFIPYFYEEKGKVRFIPINPRAVQYYDWNFGDGSPNSNAASPFHLYESDGNYNVTLIVSDYLCPPRTYVQEITLNFDATGVADLTELKAKLYPNPAQDRVTIEIDDASIQILDVEIYDVMGRKLVQQNEVNANKVTINTSLLVAGNYNVVIRSTQGIWRTKLDIVK